MLRQLTTRESVVYRIRWSRLVGQHVLLCCLLYGGIISGDGGNGGAAGIPTATDRPFARACLVAAADGVIRSCQCYLCAAGRTSKPAGTVVDPVCSAIRQAWHDSILTSERRRDRNVVYYLLATQRCPGRLAGGIFTSGAVLGVTSTGIIPGRRSAVRYSATGGRAGGGDSGLLATAVGFEIVHPDVRRGDGRPWAGLECVVGCRGVIWVCGLLLCLFIARAHRPSSHCLLRGPPGHGRCRVPV